MYGNSFSIVTLFTGCIGSTTAWLCLSLSPAISLISEAVLGSLSRIKIWILNQRALVKAESII
jgi:hypothetical protein